MKSGIENKVAFLLRAYSKKELRLLYGVSEDTFCRWIKAIPEAAASGRKNILSVAQVEAILKVKGTPGEREFN